MALDPVGGANERLQNGNDASDDRRDYMLIWLRRPQSGAQFELSRGNAGVSGSAPADASRTSRPMHQRRQSTILSAYPWEPPDMVDAYVARGAS